MSELREAAAIPAHTRDECARLCGTSRANLYKAWSEGRGPRFFYAGAKRRRITEEARREWIKKLEKETARSLKKEGER